MSEPRHEGGGGSLVRPFLNRAPAKRATAEPAAPAEPSAGVRAYMITGGRTSSRGAKLEFETMVSLSDQGRAQLNRLMFEQAKIADQCLVGPQSVAELAAKLRIPLGVAQVLAGDMVADGALSAHSAKVNQDNDIELIKRLIHGVRAL
jgi:hypothetical protein